ncbi:Uncharacterised protein [Corynebacterium kutscheri]|uniref:TIGR03089 family protein n=1 Tax=Corynebacterium kutscheri TaxID=35755 RepID=A0A0F6R0W7_9CORY|nr:TIGR03089 family protein [Corynebacterium kutscheri]AKE40693.1 TIGR03089 family protein [Corynebacterium kutscheri]VEH04690.1 Uncharacterised protein [Corynebacterium kutscheri]VEH11090.1 Uncharacterised protein [Corynebacterium kutscheri]VEH80432.1 Uncharacterised protein [Corynebacterium kutscheri]
MNLLSSLLHDDPARPRLTVYNESTGSRVDFSAQTLDNWTAKVAHFLREELDLDQGSTISIALPPSWQTIVIVLGALATDIKVNITNNPDAVQQPSDVLFCTPTSALNTSFDGDLVVVTDDPLGRGVIETGQQLAPAAIDFAPTVRFYGDQYYDPTPELAKVVTAGTPDRVLCTGWHNYRGLEKAVLAPLAGLGSSVIVRGLIDDKRLTAIAEMEKVTAFIDENPT